MMSSDGTNSRTRTTPSRGKRRGDSAERVFEQLLDDILAGVIPPGHKLSEASVAARFSVSRGPVREALRRIEERGLISSRHNASARVITFTASDFLNMIQMREALEGMACRLAAERMSKEQIDELDAYLEQRSKADAMEAPMTSDGNPDLSYRDIDLGFHYRIARGCGNPMLSKVLCEDFFRTMRIWRRYLNGVPRRGGVDKKEHEKILLAIRDREPDFAETLMRRHIRSIHDNYIRFLGDPNVPGSAPQPGQPIPATGVAGLDAAAESPDRTEAER